MKKTLKELQKKEDTVRTYMKRRRLKAGNCLNHIRVFLGMPNNLQSQCVVCQGKGRGQDGAINLRHCWLESGETVIDLTKPERFFHKEYYYARGGVDENKVVRYSIKEICAKILPDSCMTFFDLEE